MTDPQHKLDLPKELVKGLTVHANVGQEMIVTTSDKMRLCLGRHLGKVGARSAWIGPFSVLLALVTTILTADFTRYPWILDVFKVASGLISLWLAWELIRAFKSGNPINSPDPIDQIIAELKKDQGDITIEPLSEPKAK